MSRVARWGAVVAVGAIVAGGAVLFARFGWFTEVVVAGDPGGSPLVGILSLLVGLAWAVCGLVVVWRTSNVIGWVSIAIGLCFGLQWIGWVVWAGVRAGGSVGFLLGAVAGILEAAWFPAMVHMIVVLPLLFPTGQLPSRRWSWVGWLAAATFVVYVVHIVQMIATGRYMEAFAEDDLVVLLLFGLALPASAGAVVSLVGRFRRAGPVVRRQITWVTVALVVVALTVLLLFVDVPESVFGRQLGPAVAFSSFGLVPLAIMAAILRYRLFEIDRIVGRTVTYVVTIGVLGAVYAGSVIGLRSLLPVSGDLPVALSTLVVAFAFLPLLQRVQRAVDRRFSRSRYDAAVVVARLAEELKSSLELGEVKARAGDVVEEVFRPQAAGIWLADGR